MRFCEKLQELRKENGISQEKLAEKINVSRQAISKWELGVVAPDTDNILKLSKFFHVPVEYILIDTYDSLEEYNESQGIVEGTQVDNEQTSKKEIRNLNTWSIVLLSVGVISIAIASVLTYKVQAWEMELKGSSYTNAINYLGEFPLVIVVGIGVLCICLSIYLLVKKRSEKGKVNKSEIKE